MQVRAIELPTPDGVLRGKIAVTTGPMPLSGLAPTAYALTEGLVERANRLEEDAGRTISCRAGCGACCRQMVPLSPPEALYLMDLIESLEAPARAALLARFEEIVGIVTERGMVEGLLDPSPTDEPTLPIARAYFKLGLACPFLENESCGIHPRRPVACRDHNVTSPAEWCAQPYEHDIAKVPMPIPLSVSLSRLTASLTGERACLIPLTLVPYWVERHAELRTRRWPGPELFDHFMREIGARGPVARPEQGS
jgi:Fe-S-cluster containining protein